MGGREDEGGRGWETCVGRISVGYEREIDRMWRGRRFFSPERQDTDATATPAVISSDTIFCLFEFLGPIPTRGVGGLNR